MIYFLRADDTLYVKVGVVDTEPGWRRTIRDRRSELQSDFPFQLHIEAAWPGTYHDETCVKRELTRRGKKIRGEWFRLTKEEVAAFATGIPDPGPEPKVPDTFLWFARREALLRYFILRGKEMSFSTFWALLPKLHEAFASLRGTANYEFDETQYQQMVAELKGTEKDTRAKIREYNAELQAWKDRCKERDLYINGQHPCQRTPSPQMLAALTHPDTPKKRRKPWVKPFM